MSTAATPKAYDVQIAVNGHVLWVETAAAETAEELASWIEGNQLIVDPGSGYTITLTEVVNSGEPVGDPQVFEVSA